MFGSGYVIDHVVAEHNSRAKEEGYRLYMSDLMKCLAEVMGVTVNYRYADTVAKPEKEDERTGDEIALEVITKLGLKGKSDGLHEDESDIVA